MRSLYTLLVAAGLLLARATTVLAQPAHPLEADEAVRLALARSSPLQAARAEAAAARAVHRQARARRLPALATQASYTRLSDNIPEVSFDVPPLPGLDSTSFTLAPVELNRYHAQLSLDQPLFTGFRLRNQVAAAAHQAEAAAQAAAQAEVDAAYAARRAYWELVRALALRDVVARARAGVEAHLADVVNRRSVGAATESDVRAARTRRAEVRLDSVEAENAVRLARLELNRLTGLALDTPTTPSNLSAGAASLPGDVDALVAQALAARPQLRALAEQARAAGADVAARRGTWLPDVAFSGRYVYARPNPYFFLEQNTFKGTWEAGLNVARSLWDGGQRAAQVGEARARLQGIEARHAEAREEVAVAVHRAFLEGERALLAATVADEGVAEAEEAFRLAQGRYREGAALASEVLEAELALARAAARRAEARADEALAHAALLHTVGLVW